MGKALDEDTKECSCTDILARIFLINSVFVNVFMAIADTGTIFQIFIIVDLNEIMLWRRSFLKQVRQHRMENTRSHVSLNVD